MNIKMIVSTVIALILAFNPADAVSYKKHDKIIRKAKKIYYGLHSSGIEWKVMGRSNWKNRIYYKEFGSGEKLTMIIGGMHGDEPAGFISTVRLAQYIEKNPRSIKNRVIIIPCINPDGLISGRRTNGQKIDINRNFPTTSWSQEYSKSYNHPGYIPGSEPETVIIVNAIEDYKPDLIIQMHQPFGAIYPEKNTPAGLLQIMSKTSGFPVSEDIGYATPGSLGNYGLTLDYIVQGVTYELGAIDYEPDYKKVTKSLIEAINYQK